MWSSLFQLPNTLIYTCALPSGESLCVHRPDIWALWADAVESEVCQIYAFSEKCYCGVDLFLKFLHLPHSVSKLYAHSVLYVLCIWVPVISWMSQMVLCRCTVFSKLLIFLSCIAQRSNVISLFDMLLTTGGVWELHVALLVCPLRWLFCFLGHGYFHFVPCIPLFWMLWFIYDWHHLMLHSKLYRHNKL